MLINKRWVWLMLAKTNIPHEYKTLNNGECINDGKKIKTNKGKPI